MAGWIAITLMGVTFHNTISFFTKVTPIHTFHTPMSSIPTRIPPH